MCNRLQYNGETLGVSGRTLLWCWRLTQLGNWTGQNHCYFMLLDSLEAEKYVGQDFYAAKLFTHRQELCR